MTTTALWTVRTALVTQFTAALATASIAAPVFDGPRARASEPKLFLLVGSEGGDDGTGDPFTDDNITNQVQSPMGNTWREESGDVLCSAWAWSGATASAPVRASVASVVDVCAATLSADRTLGGLFINEGAYAELSGLRVREGQGPRGFVCRAAFTVSYHRALLT